MLLLGVIQAQASGAGAGSFDLLETQVLSSSASSVTFSGLSAYAADYQHLQIRLVGRSDQAQEYAGVALRFNGDSGTSYSWHAVKGDGSSVTSTGATNTTAVQSSQWEIPGASNAANIFGAVVYDILDPFEITKYKTVRWFGGRGAVNTGDKQIVLASGAWRNTSAASSISLTANGNFVTGSRFSLYGLRKAA